MQASPNMVTGLPISGIKKPKRKIKERLYERRFIVPNAVTVGNMFCGFLAIIYASSGRFEKACLAIFIAIILDGLDGRVARKLNATSKFGVEYDSFSDLVSFGVAPALLMYHWAFKPVADEFGVVVCFFYAVCAASRLARFNVSAENLAAFTGLPSPGAAWALTSFIFLQPFAAAQEQVFVFSNVAVCALLTAVIGYLMISRIEFLSIKKLQLSRFRLRARLFAAAIVGMIWYYPKAIAFLLAIGYALSGPIIEILKKRRAAKQP